MSETERQDIRRRLSDALDRDDRGSALDAISRAFQLFNEGRIDDWLDFFADDAEWHTAAQSFEQSHRGREGIKRFFDEQSEGWEAFRIELEDLRVQGEEMVLLVRQRGRGRASGLEIEVRVAYVCTVRNGEIVRFRLFPDRRAALSAVGLDSDG